MPKGVKKSKSKSKPKTTPNYNVEDGDKKSFNPGKKPSLFNPKAQRGERRLSCNLCNYSTTRISNLQVHIRYHLGEKPFKCPEFKSGCNYSSCEKPKVTAHHKAVHVGEKRFECPVSGCGHKAGFKHGLMRHMTTHEENPEKPFKCGKCPYEAKTNGDIKSHSSQVHSEERNFKCQNGGCSYAGKTKANLAHHLQTHGEKTLTCPQSNCEYRTNVKTSLKKHMKIHALDSEKRYKCRLCDYSAHQAGGLTTHMRTHTKETPYKCKIQGCLYESKTPGSLKQHMKSVHEEIRPFKCPVSGYGCQYSTAQKANLKKHLIKCHSKNIRLSP